MGTMTPHLTPAPASAGVPDPAERNRLFARYVEPFLPRLRAYVQWRSPRPDQSDDHYQEVVLHILEHIHRYDPAAGLPLPWLYSVASHCLDNLLPRGARRDAQWWADHPSFYVDDPDELSDALTAPAATAASDCALQPHSCGCSPLSSPLSAPRLTPHPDDYSPALYRALVALPILQQRALMLSSEGWSPADIAAELRTTPGAARALLCRARARMQRCLGR